MNLVNNIFDSIKGLLKYQGFGFGYTNLYSGCVVSFIETHSGLCPSLYDSLLIKSFSKRLSCFDTFLKSFKVGGHGGGLCV